MVVPTHLRALGRLRTGERNKTEAAYEAHLQALMHAGEILWYGFEGIKLRLADSTFFTVDFPVLPKSGVLEMHEVKGSRGIFADDAKVKIKVAAALYPFVFKVAFSRPKRDGGGFEVVEI